MKDWIAAAVVLILAIAFAALIIIYALYVVVYGKTLQPPASTTLATAVGGIAGILGAYIGRNGGRRGPE